MCDLLGDEANLYICDRVSMAKKTAEVVHASMKKKHNWDDAQLASWVESRKKTNKWMEDVWG